MKICLLGLDRHILLLKRILGVLIIILMASTPVSADSYLDALNEEVSKPEYVREAEQEIQRVSQQQDHDSPAMKRDVSTALTDIARFENLLQSKYPATYQVYLKLNKTSKSDVFQTFQDGRHLTDASKKVLELYLR